MPLKLVASSLTVALHGDRLHVRRGVWLQRRAQAIWPVRRACGVPRATMPAAGPPDYVSQLVQQIHATPTQAVLYCTGGGVQALAWLLGAPGASRTVLEARVPYATSAVTDAIGGAALSSGYASPEAAGALARAAYKQAAHLAGFGTPILGLGCACALATDRPRRGEHQVHVATHNAGATRTLSVRLDKGARNRRSEDAVASEIVILALARACGLDSMPAAPPGLAAVPGADAAGVDDLQERVQHSGDPLQALLEGRAACVEYAGGQVVVDAPRHARVVLPGSFNPLHEGHKGLLAAGVAQVGGDAEGCFELSVGNPDKGMLPLEEARHRIAQFTGDGTPLLVTRAALFTDKAALLPSASFVVGHDTAVRLVLPKYYGGAEPMLLQFAALAAAKCRFLVAGRVGEDGRYLTLEDVEVPTDLAGLNLFQGIPEAHFRADISSTALRRARESGGAAA